eukprot:688717-Pyramimonas_sp.AAC.1
MAQKFSPLFSLGAELQAFKGAPPKDHIPVYMELHGMQALCTTETPTPERMRWNQDDLMQCLRRGHRRVEFLEK